MTDMTDFIQDLSKGLSGTEDERLASIYRQLRQIAAARLSRESSDHTLQPTALVHEAYLRLIGPDDRSWENRAHFFASAVEAMRRILIDHARSKSAQKRGGGKQNITLHEEDVANPQRCDQLLLLDEAIESLELLDPAKAQLVKMKFFAGMTTAEAAQILDLSDRTAERHWAYARVWLLRELNEQLNASD
jgi:RNA polymerase sigma factor (TIGR02999 family)